ncbi:MAG: PQQ-binding-like beta-propeller repeat protein [Thermoplasmata archaeon]
MRLARVIILLLIVGFFLFYTTQPEPAHGDVANQTRGPETTGEWSEFRGNLNNTGYSLSSVPSANRTFLKFYANFQVRSSAVAKGDIIYFGSDYGRIYAVNVSTGKEVWNYTTGGEIWASPLVAGDKVYIGSSDDSLYALDRTTGNLSWTHPTGDDVYSSAKYLDGKVVFGSLDGNLYLLDSETGGETIAPFHTNGSIYGTPAIVNGTAIFGSNDGKVYRVSIENGSELWNFTRSAVPGGEVKYTSAAVFGDRVYIGSNDHNFYCLDLDTGDLVWQFQTGLFVYASPAIHDGVVYVHSTDGHLYALPLGDPNGDGNMSSGEILWMFETRDAGGGIEGGSSPAIADGKVIVGARIRYSEGYLYVIDVETHEEVWRLRLWGTYSSPTVVGGRIYIGAADGYMYGIAELAPGMTLEIVPEKHTLESERLMVIEFNVTYAGEPVEGAFIKFDVTDGVLSQSGASTLADGIQRVKYLSPKVSENITVTISGRATKYGMEEARSSVDIIITPAADYKGTASGTVFSLEGYLPSIVAIATLVALNGLILVAIRLKRRSLE